MSRQSAPMGSRGRHLDAVGWCDPPAPRHLFDLHTGDWFNQRIAICNCRELDRCGMSSASEVANV